MRRKARVDKNQPNVVKLLKDPRSLGASVSITSILGKGFPDFIVGVENINFMVELKTGNSGLTKDEKEWHMNWQGQVRTARSALEVTIALRNYAEGLRNNIQQVIDRCYRAEEFLRQVEENSNE